MDTSRHKGEDILVRAMARDGSFRAMACTCSQLVSDACRRHGTYPTASAALGRVLAGAALMGALLDGEQRLALKFEGSGPLGKILAEADSRGMVKGYVANPQVDLPPKNGKLDVAGALGRTGFLTVSKDLRLKDLYTGIVHLVSGEIAKDLAYYFAESEQIPSAVGLGVFVEKGGRISAAGGFLIQTLPPTNEALVEQLEKQVLALPSLTGVLREDTTPEGLLELLLRDIDYEILERRRLAFGCTCSRERIEQALITLGEEGIGGILDREEVTEVTCEYCRKKYAFSRHALLRLLSEMH